MSSKEPARALDTEQRGTQSCARFEIQGLSLSKERFASEQEAQTWATENGFAADSLEETRESWVLPQRKRGEFSRESLRSFDVDEGVTAIGGVIAAQERDESRTDCMVVEPLFKASRFGEGRKIALRAKLPQIETGNTAWVHMAFEGEWHGHPMGPFEFDRDVFEQIVANFDRQTNNIPVYFEHDFIPGNPRPTAGWIFDIKITDCDEHGAELWAHVEFTDRTAQMIRDGEYSFCSVVVDFESEERMSAEEIGAELLELGLTDSPFLDSQHSIQLSRRHTRASHQPQKERRSARQRRLSMPTLDELLKEAREAAGEDASIEQFERVFQAVKAKHQAVQDAQGGGESGPGEEDKTAASHEPREDATAASLETPEPTPEPSPQPAPAPAAEENSDERQLAMDEAVMAQAEGALTRIAETLGTDLTDVVARLDESADKIADVLTGGASDGSAAEEQAVQGFSQEVKEAAMGRVSALQKKVEQKDAEVKKLTDRIQALEDDRLRKRIDDAVAAGTILGSDKDRYLKLGRKNPELLDEFLADAQSSPAVPTGRQYTPRGSDAAAADDDGSDLDPQLLDVQTRCLGAVYKSKDEARKVAIKRLREQRMASA